MSVQTFDVRAVAIAPSVRFIRRDPIRLSVYKKDDTPAERYIYNVCGHDVQIIVDGGSTLTVFIDGEPQLLTLDGLKERVRELLG